jgi:diguanylate cyclase (GGDEF)-like protein
VNEKTRRQNPGVPRALFVPLGIATVAVLASVMGASFGPLDPHMDRWGLLVLEMGGAVACFARVALVREERGAWTCIAIAVSLWALGDLYYRAILYNAEVFPVPSPSDAFWLAFYPPAYAGIALLIRARARKVSATVWIDGLIAALAVASVAAAVVFDQVLGSIGGDPLATATNLIYPLADALLIAFVFGAFVITGGRFDRTWILLALSLGLFAVSDSIYLYQVAGETYQAGGLLDAGWAVALLLAGVAAWSLGGKAPAPKRVETWRSLILPVSFAVVAIGVETYDHYVRVTTIALALATLCLVAVLARLMMTFAQNLTMLHTSREEAATDPLTGLANRRRLAVDLDEVLSEHDPDPQPRLFALLDLNGFKRYNDTFGHPAGDALLERLGGRLVEAVGSAGTAYRMGGDEFCVLLPIASEASEQLISRIAAALHEHGDGFDIDASYGWVALPEDAANPETALRLVDQRMYAQKQSGRQSAGSQSKDVLLQALIERSPDLAPHLSDVAGTAVATARGLGMADADVEQIRTAGELHDIGKVAIPDAILDKPGPLNEREWEYVKAHSAVGERIVAAAPALAEVAKLVRSIHEHLNGAGYPDNLVGDEIPLGARIISVCDAFDAMTSERPYRRPMEAPDALAELRRSAGSQFDPAVVDAFCAVLEAPEPLAPEPELALPR